MPKPKLTILMLTEYFYPFERGGAERSSYYLAQSLIKKGHFVVILTPNYGTKSFEIHKQMRIYRFNIIKKLTKNDEPIHPVTVITPFWHSNLFWLFQTFRCLIKVLQRENINLIHIQGKYFLPAAILVGRLTKTPVVFTARDYHIICNLGFCLWHSQKACSLKNYFLKDFVFYKQHYMDNPSLFQIILQLLFLFHSRLITKILYFFAKQADAIVCTSADQQKIFSANGLKQTQVIYNTVNFRKKVSGREISHQIVFAGRLTPGKGTHLLIPSLSRIDSRHRPKLFIAGEGILKQKLAQQIRRYGLNLAVKLLGRIRHQELLALYGGSKAGIFPSLWPENFGRGALEAISQGMPVVTSNKGGLPEIVQGKYGISVKPEVAKLAQAIKDVLNHHSQFVARIKQDRHKLIEQFEHQPTKQYQRLYYQLIDKAT